jgi:uncharacterized membrane protein (GlpM family)
MSSEQKKLMVLAGLPLLPYPIILFFLALGNYRHGMEASGPSLWVDIVFWTIAAYPITYLAAWFFVSQSSRESTCTTALRCLAAHLIIGFIFLLFV